MLGDNKTGLKIISVDFDSTLCTDNFPNTGVIEERHQRLIEWLRKRKSEGSIIILETCREDSEEYPTALTNAVNFCKENNIPIDYVNENPLQDYKSRKIYADIKIDDRAISALNFEDDLFKYQFKDTMYI